MAEADLPLGNRQAETRAPRGGEPAIGTRSLARMYACLVLLRLVAVFDLGNLSDTAVPMVDVVEANCNAVVLALPALLVSIRWTEPGARTCLLSAKVGSHLPIQAKSCTVSCLNS